MKTLLTIIALMSVSFSAHADLKINDFSTAGFLYGFLVSMEKPVNAGDGVLMVTAEFSCTKHLAADQNSVDQYYCMNASVGGITGDLAETVYKSFSPKTEENFDGIQVRTGFATCASIEQAGLAPRYTCY